MDLVTRRPYGFPKPISEQIKIRDFAYAIPDLAFRCSYIRFIPTQAWITIHLIYLNENSLTKSVIVFSTVSLSQGKYNNFSRSENHLISVQKLKVKFYTNMASIKQTFGTDIKTNKLTGKYLPASILRCKWSFSNLIEQ